MRKILVCILFFYVATISAATMRHFNFYVDDTNISAEQVVEHFTEWFNLPHNTSFVQSNMLSDDDGYVHYCYNQYVNGVIVDGGEILVHTTNGIVQYINGIVLETEETGSPVTNKIAKKSFITANQEVFIIPIMNGTDFRYAYKYVSEELGANIYIDVENGDTLKILPFIYDVQTKITTNTIYSGHQKLTVEKSGSQCTYSVTSPRIETINSTNVDFSANTVDMFYTQIQNSTAYQETIADSLSSYLTSVTFHIKDNEWWSDLEEGTTMPDLYLKIYNSSNVLVYQSQICENWEYLDITFNPMLKIDGGTYSIKIYDQDLISDDYGGGFTISSPTKGIGTLSLNNFDITVCVAGNPIRDAHWGMEKTLAFYKNVLNRSSYDGNGATIYQFVNPFMPQKLPNQAFASGEAPFCMVYGLGDGIHKYPLVALDVMAHEFTHMVTAHNIVGGLDYNGESGALNEGFSDIFAVLTEGYTYGQYDWTIGEKFELQNPFTRSFKNPKAGNPSQPTTYGQGPWKDPNSNEDYGGVHYNSGVLNYWFYLLCIGGTGKNDNQKSYSVQGIGTSKATKIAYNTLMTGLTKTATFTDARESSIKETIKLYGKDSQEHQSVVNAWYAVGVGSKYVAPESTITIKAKMPSNWGSPISAWAWTEGSEGNWVTLAKEGEWYSYTTTENPLNIVFINGTTWNGDNNQTIDITTSESMCIQIGSNTSGKRTYTTIDCPEPSTPVVCKSVPYSETFASSQGDFTIQNVTLPNGFTYIWKWNSQYGMVASCIKNSTKYASESWLISPCIEIPSTGMCVLTFSHAAKFFQNTSQMTLWVSADYHEGAPSTATWQQLTIPTYPTGQNWNWFESGEIDLSAYKDKKISLAFKYTSTTSYAPQWEIKNFAVKKVSSQDVECVLSPQPSATKVLMDGQIYIIRGSHFFDTQGKMVR